jgi:hypothetical protein
MNDDISADKLARAVERLEQERAKRAGPAPVVPLVVERVFVGDAPARFAPPAPVKVEPRPRRKKPREARLTPVPFFITMGKPSPNDPGRIEEGQYVQDGDKICLCDADGTPAGDWRRVEGPGALYIARTMLRAKLAARTPGAVDHSPIRYPVLKY